MAPFSCFPGGSCGSCGSCGCPSPRAGPEEQGKRTAGGWDCELGNGMELQEAQRSMVGDFELIFGLKDVGFGGRWSWWKVWENSWEKSGWFESKADVLFYFVYSKSSYFAKLTDCICLLGKRHFGVAQHQPAAVHFFLPIGLVWLRLHVLQMSKRAFQSSLNGLEPEVLTSTRPGWGLLPDVFFKNQCGDGDVLVTKKTP